MSSIALIGTEACGKTVFITTLAKRFTAPDQNGIFIEPRNRKTTSYVERVWKKLSECDWPAFTAQGELNDLKWTFHAGKDVKCDIRLVDCAGHDLRVLFADEQVDQIDTLPEALKTVADYCRQADIVLFMVNLGDFLAQGDDERLVANQWAIKYAMDYVQNGTGGRHYCLLFSQADRYCHLEREYGSWDAIAKKFLPHVHSTHLHGGKAPILPVAAVADTKERVIRGRRRVVPELNFTSRGLELVVEWLAQSTHSILARQAAEAEEKKQRERQEQQQEELARRQEEARREQLGREQKEQRQREIQEQRAEERRRRARQAIPWAIAAFVASLVVFYPAAWGLGRYLAPQIEIREVVEEVPSYTEEPVFEDRPNFVKVPKYKNVWVSESVPLLPWTWGSGRWEKREDGEEVVQKGTIKVEVGKKKVPTGVQKVTKTAPVVVGVLPEVSFWVYLFPFCLAIVDAGGAFWYAYDRHSRQQGS